MELIHELALLIITLVVIISIHEFLHGICGFSKGFSLYSIRILWFNFDFYKGKRVEFSFKPIKSSIGLCGIFPKERNTTAQFVGMILAGPLSTVIIFLLMSLYIFLSKSNSKLLLSIQDNLLLLSILMFLPSTTSGENFLGIRKSYSDGMIILKWLKKDINIYLYSVFFTILGKEISRKRISEMDFNLLTKEIDLEKAKSSDFFISYFSHHMLYYLDNLSLGMEKENIKKIIDDNKKVMYKDYYFPRGSKAIYLIYLLATEDYYNSKEYYELNSQWFSKENDYETCIAMYLYKKIILGTEVKSLLEPFEARFKNNYILSRDYLYEDLIDNLKSTYKAI